MFSEAVNHSHSCCYAPQKPSLGFLDQTCCDHFISMGPETVLSQHNRRIVRVSNIKQYAWWYVATTWWICKAMWPNPFEWGAGQSIPKKCLLCLSSLRLQQQYAAVLFPELWILHMLQDRLSLRIYISCHYFKIAHHSLLHCKVNCMTIVCAGYTDEVAGSDKSAKLRCYKRTPLNIRCPAT